MKGYTIRLSTALLTFVVGVTLASGWLINRHTQLKQPRSEAAAGQSVQAETFIKLERAGCFDDCISPSYTLTIFADGAVVFDGRLSWVEDSGELKFIRDTGPVISHLSSEQLRQLISAFEEVDYFSLRDSYEREGCPAYTGSMPRVYIEFQFNGRRKRIEHYLGCVEKGDRLVVYPQELYKLEERIDEIVNTKQWTQ